MRRFILVAALLLVANAQAQAQSDVAKVEAGAQFTSIIASDPPIFPRVTLTRWVPGFGGRFTFNLTNHVALEAEGNFFPRGGESDRIGEGRKAQALFGVKAGMRKDKFGVFGKVRPGFMYFSEPHLECPEEEFICHEVRRIRLAVDLGAVVEVYPSHRWLIRFDMGDTLISFPDIRMSVSEPGFPTLRGTSPGSITHNFQFSTGIGIRF